MKLVQLTMVVEGRHQIHNEEGEDDGLAVTTRTEATSEVMVNAEEIRCFYPRKPNRDGTPRTGTRLTFKNGSGMPVTELFNEVAEKLGRAN
jgi:hypothetical protein